MNASTTLRAAIGRVPETMPIWQGKVGSDRFGLDLVRVEPFYTAFGRMVRNLEFDLSEMPVSRRPKRSNMAFR